MSNVNADPFPWFAARVGFRIDSVEEGLSINTEANMDLLEIIDGRWRDRVLNTPRRRGIFLLSVVGVLVAALVYSWLK